MKHLSKDVTNLVLIALVSIFTISGAIAGFYGAFMSRQAVVETKLIHIQRELETISAAMGDREIDLRDLGQRIAGLEAKVENLDRRISFYGENH